MNQENTTPNTPPPFSHQETPRAPELPENPSWGTLFEALLKHPHALISLFTSEKNKFALSLKLLILAGVSLLVFGLTIGSFAMNEQLWATPVKALFGLLAAALICLPSLYIFTAITSTPLRFAQIAQGFVAALALLGAILLGFVPVLWIFSQSTNSIGFMGFLVILAWLIALFFGTGFLLKMLKSTGEFSATPLRVWIGIFLLVTLQMSTSLRPLIGRSEHFLTNEKKSFLEHWLQTMPEKLHNENSSADQPHPSL